MVELYREIAFFPYIFDSHEKLMWVYVMNSVRPAGRPDDCPYVAKTLTLRFLGHYNNDKCQTLHDGSTHWALLIHSIFWAKIVFHVIAASNSFDWKCYVLIRLSWIFIWLLITSIKSWTYPYFEFCTCSREIIHISSSCKRSHVDFFSDAIETRSFKLCIIITLLGFTFSL